MHTYERLAGRCLARGSPKIAPRQLQRTRHLARDAGALTHRSPFALLAIGEAMRAVVLPAALRSLCHRVRSTTAVHVGATGRGRFVGAICSRILRSPRLRGC